MKTIAITSHTFCCIDTAPAISKQTAAFVDVDYYPGTAFRSDLWAVTETVQLVKDAEKPFLFVTTQAKEMA
ncbi:MAG: hypothetical protein JO307_11030, partial [Bryobacterales bacterium]|nr:hypothetical protein [Bryobacterales bacterium]